MKKKIFACMALVFSLEANAGSSDFKECFDRKVNEWRSSLDLDEHSMPGGDFRWELEDECNQEISSNDAKKDTTSDTAGSYTMEVRANAGSSQWLGPYMEVTNTGDPLTITGYTVNRGTCQDVPTMARPPKLKFGQTTKLSQGFNCRVLEVVIMTDVGDFKWEFK